VARGDAEIALHQMQELRAVPGVAVVGPFPGDLDGKFLFSPVLISGTTRQKAGEQLIAFLISPPAKAVMRNQGLEPFSTAR
jgi:molybdate transport system substrate-binding protein